MLSTTCNLHSVRTCCVKLHMATPRALPLLAALHCGDLRLVGCGSQNLGVQLPSCQTIPKCVSECMLSTPQHWAEKEHLLRAPPCVANSLLGSPVWRAAGAVLIGLMLSWAGLICYSCLLTQAQP